MIRLNNVTKKFGSNEVLKGIDLTVKTGEKLVIIGPSGSGKSTLIRLMNGLEETSSGTVEIDGKQMTRQSRAKLNREYSSMVFQQFNLYPHKTVLENLTLAPRLVPLNVSTKDISELLCCMASGGLVELMRKVHINRKRGI